VAVCVVVSVSLMTVAEAGKPADAQKALPTAGSSSSQIQLQVMLSRSRLDVRLWLQCRLALTNSLLLTFSGLCGSDG